MAASPEKTKRVTVESCDGQKFETDENIVLQFPPVKRALEDGKTWTPGTMTVRFPVTGEIFAKVIEYCENHAKPDATKDAWKQWLAKFAKDDDCQTLLDLSAVARYLNIMDLFDLTNQTIADMIKVKSVEEIRAFLKIENDLTPEMEAQLRAENGWAYV